MKCFRQLLVISSLFVLAQSHPPFSADDCLFYLPLTNSSCVVYNFQDIATAGPYKMSTPEYSYIIGLCGNISSSAMPAQCNASGPAVAYQYNSTSCYALGIANNESTYVYPIIASENNGGIRVVYSNGMGGTSATWPRAIMLDFTYAEGAINKGPIDITEYPTYTYTARWPTPHTASTKTGQACSLRHFDGTWDTLRFRPRPRWYDNAKFGIFIHWGLFSVPSFKNEWYWKNLMGGNADYVEFHNRVYGCSGVMPDKYPCEGPTFKYADFAPMFKAEMFDPDKWADLFKRAGAKYVVLTSKHHEGWCNFPSAYHWNWNSVDEGPKRDLTGDLTKSVRAAGLHMGLYHSLREWYNPLYIKDNENQCNTTAFPDEVLIPTLHEIVNNYKPEVIWADGAGDAPCTHDSVKYWKAPEFLSWLYNDSPVKDTVLVNSRWGNSALGDYQTGGDRFTPGKLLPYKWESCYTIQKSSWGYDRTEGLESFENVTQLLMQLVSSVSCNGNLLLNVGPTSDGRILPTFEERLLEMGAWLEINGEAIYNSTPWRVQNDTADKMTWYTASKDGGSVYAITFVSPVPGEDVVLRQPVTTSDTSIFLLGPYGNTALKFSQESDGVHITFPSAVPYNTTFKYAWTYKMAFVK